MRRIRLINRKTTVWLSVTLLSLFLIILLILRFIPPDTDRIGNSKALLEYSRHYEVCIDGQTAFYMDDYERWTTARISVNGLDIPTTNSTVTGLWTRQFFSPFCRGRLLAHGTDPSAWEQKQNDSIAHTLKKGLPILQHRAAALEKRIEELQYFLRVHNVMDEGYTVIANYKTRSEAELRNIQKVVELLADTTRYADMTVRMVQHYALTDGEAQARPCRILTMNAQDSTCLVQTEDYWMPDSAYSLYASDFATRLRREADSVLNIPTDTVNAVIETKNGTYHGETDSRWKPQGHGIMTSPNGKVYDGMWLSGMRNGFGISLDSDGNVRIGEWKDDVYQGERPTYTAEHIYGIDVSRHQHEKGKHKHGIHWPKVRITHLGSKSAKRISGNVDYPVDFCFIKSTEGASIVNKYYASDYMRARQAGIRVGTYHFFSVKSDIRNQVHFFLKNSRFRPGDLPPVLDVEPTNSQIQNYGGTEKLLTAMRTWLRMVEERVGVKPILYVNQNFVTKHLAQAPDIKRDYRIWIARYGEYKPDLRLTIWQLSADGRVSGITGDVDINVFNGYRDPYEEFLEQDTIRAR